MAGFRPTLLTWWVRGEFLLGGSLKADAAKAEGAKHTGALDLQRLVHHLLAESEFAIKHDSAIWLESTVSTIRLEFLN